MCYVVGRIGSVIEICRDLEPDGAANLSDGTKTSLPYAFVSSSKEIQDTLQKLGMVSEEYLNNALNNGNKPFIVKITPSFITNYKRDIEKD